MNKLLEPQMKSFLLSHLRSSGKIHSDTTIINELFIDKSSRRVDLALVNHNEIFAYEIKSEADSLQRLQGQIEKYSNYFDKVIIFAATKHIDKILATVPDSVAVWELNTSQLKVRQRGTKARVKNINSYLSMMHAKDLHKLAISLKLAPTKSYRAGLTESLQSAPLPLVRAAALESLRARYEITTKLFLKNSTFETNTDDLKLLSPNNNEFFAREHTTNLKDSPESLFI